MAASSHPVDYEIGSPPGLRAAACISRWPVRVSPGVLLQWSEFLEVERPLNVHPDLLSLIFIWTVGHVRTVAFDVVLGELSCQLQLLESLISALQKVSEMRHGEQFTVQDFYDGNPVHLLVRRLDAGAFERGLPQVFSPDFVALITRRSQN